MKYIVTSNKSILSSLLISASGKMEQFFLFLILMKTYIPGCFGADAVASLVS